MSLLRRDYQGYVYADGCRYNDSPLCLETAAQEWRECAWSVVKSAQQDTDWAYRLMGAQAARHRRNIALELLVASKEVTR